MSEATVVKELSKYINEEKSNVFPRFFKTGKGEYGEGDEFLGVAVPDVRTVARGHLADSLSEVESLFSSRWNEVRLCALLILVEKFRNTAKRSWKRQYGESEAMALRDSIYDVYLTHTRRINNWNLVDLSSPYIVGEYLLDHPREVLYSLVQSDWLWDQRIAVVSTLTFIRNSQYDDILRLAEMLMDHPHDLMHKATGWMLREVGKRDKKRLVMFLDRYASSMPRTMLRYSIEKFPYDERQRYLGKKGALSSSATSNV